MTRHTTVLACIWALLLTGCPDDDEPPASADTGLAQDLGEPDAGPEDTASVDAGAEDTGSEDTILDTGESADTAAPEDTLAPTGCEPMPTEEAMRTLSEELDDGRRVLFGGRAAGPAGQSLALEGFPGLIALHPTLNVAYVVSGSRKQRLLFVVDLTTMTVLQQLDRDSIYWGITLDSGGTRLYLSAGKQNAIDAFDVAPDGQLTESTRLPLGEQASGLALSADDSTLWVGLVTESELVQVDAVNMTEVQRLELPHIVWDVALVPQTNSLYLSDISSASLSVVDLETLTVTDTLSLPTAPAGLEVHPDGSRVWAAVSGSDAVAAIDTSTHEVVSFTPVAENDLTDEEGDPLPNSNVNSLAYDETTGRLYAARGADNAVTVFDSSDMTPLGTLPAAWYPTDLAWRDGSLIVTEGRGFGTTNQTGDAKSANLGSITRVTLADIDLADATEQAKADYGRSTAVFPFECEGEFPIPSKPGQTSPIEHVILIVKENKTFDCVLADLADEIDIDADPEFLRWPEEVTPNMHSLARAFALSDNFYTESPNSDTGHTFLTTAHLTEFAWRAFLFDNQSDVFDGYPVLPSSVPSVGNVFTHLLDHDISVRIYGEIVGTFAVSQGGILVATTSDPEFPGGTFVNYDVKDEDKAKYVANRIAQGDLAQFTYLLLPNDHTVGTSPGKPTPESMVADNDYAVGLVIEALAQSPFWEKSVVFVLQDDPQGCSDHVDAHRSPLFVVSPWARREYVSHVTASFVSVFATITRILGVPPVGRPDAAAAPLWDMFTTEMDATAYLAKEREIPEAANKPGLPGGAASDKMDFRSPDRNPALWRVLDAYRQWKMGRLTREQADALIANPAVGDPLWEERLEESSEESFVFDRDYARYRQWMQERGLTPKPLTNRADTPATP